MIVKRSGKLLENGDVTTTTRPPILIYKRCSSITLKINNKFRAPTVTSDVITASTKFVSDKQQQLSTYTESNCSYNVSFWL